MPETKAPSAASHFLAYDSLLQQYRSEVTKKLTPQDKSVTRVPKIFSRSNELSGGIRLRREAVRRDAAAATGTVALPILPEALLGKLWQCGLHRLLNSCYFACTPTASSCFRQCTA